MVTKVTVLVITTPYWKPGEDYRENIVTAIAREVEDGDFVTVSDKALSVARGNIIDEKPVHAGRVARFIAKYWMRLVWPYFLGNLCHLRRKTLRHLRAYPTDEGSAHKQVALGQSGVLQALMPGSEGGIDGSNLPYSYVSLPLKNAPQLAREIQRHITSKLNKSVTFVIVDTDKTYSLKGFHFTPRPNPIRGIHSFGGVLSYVMGRMLKLKERATPLAVAGANMPTDEAIEIAKIANRSRGSGAGRTVWDMAKTFGVTLTGVTWEMLSKVKHKPIVIVRYHNT